MVLLDAGILMHLLGGVCALNPPPQGSRALDPLLPTSPWCHQITSVVIALLLGTSGQGRCGQLWMPRQLSSEDTSVPYRVRGVERN